MEIVRVLAGFSPGDADLMRKVMSKKLTDEMLEFRKKFLEGTKRRKYQPEEGRDDIRPYRPLRRLRF